MTDRPVKQPDRGFVVEAEDRGQVQRVGSVGEGFVELAVDAEPFEGGGEPANGFGGPPSAGRPIIERGVPRDDQVRVGGVRPAIAPVGQPVEYDLVSEVVERADVPGDAQAPVAEVDIVEAGLANGLGPSGVDRGQCEDDPDGRVGLGRGDGLVDVVRLQRQDRSRGVTADADPDGGSRKIVPLVLQ